MPSPTTTHMAAMSMERGLPTLSQKPSPTTMATHMAAMSMERGLPTPSQKPNPTTMASVATTVAGMERGLPMLSQ